jgi:Zn-finger nucleic acid-binding protein
MRCPNDESTLVMSERNGIEIDYCPQCRGVWLDRGELDKIIERSMNQQAPAAPPPQPGGYERDRDQRHDQYQQRYQQPYRKKKKESWLSEIFD